MPEEDPYKILGVEKNATQEEIKKAYRNLSLKLHPDRNHGKPDATAIYQSINAAYEILGDETRRKEYDNPRPSPQSQQQHHHFQFGMGGMPFPFAGMGMGGNHNPHDDFIKLFSSGIFQQMHQGGGGDGTTQFFTIGPNGPIRVQMNTQPNIQKPPPISKVVEISIDKAYNGCVIPVEVTRWIIESGVKKEENETLYVTIPRGIDDNEMIIITGKGHQANGENNRSDVKIQVKVKNDTAFKRDGLDLILQKSISLKEALCGFSFDMTFIDNRIFKINNQNGNVIYPNYKKLISGMGMVRDDKIGNLNIIFDITFPENLSSEAIATISSVL